MSIKEAKQQSEVMMKLIDEVSPDKKRVLIRKFAQAIADGTEKEAIQEEICQK